MKGKLANELKSSSLVSVCKTFLFNQLTNVYIKDGEYKNMPLSDLSREHKNMPLSDLSREHKNMPLSDLSREQKSFNLFSVNVDNKDVGPETQRKPYRTALNGMITFFNKEIDTGGQLFKKKTGHTQNSPPGKLALV